MEQNPKTFSDAAAPMSHEAALLQLRHMRVQLKMAQAALEEARAVLAKERWRADEAERMLEEKEMESITDPLTKVLNRRGFMRALVKRIEETEGSHEGLQTALVMLDLDGFKALNDKCGHVQGDKVLQLVAERLKENFNEDGAVVARLGGDEMILFVPYQQAGSFEEFENEVKERIHSICSDLTFWAEGHPYPVGASVGITAFNRDSINMNDEKRTRNLISNLLSTVDHKMYEDKALNKEHRLAAAREAAHRATNAAGIQSCEL